MMDELFIQAVPERLYHRIVVAVGPTARAGGDPHVGEGL